MMIITFFLSFSFTLYIIERQKVLKVGQIERELGLRSHKVKNNTPTLGGISFLIVTSLIFIFISLFNKFDFKITFLILLPFISYGILGLIDDLLIIKYKNNKGISPILKFLIQIFIAAIYFIVYLSLDFSTKLDLIFFEIDLKFMYGIFILLAFSGFSNATNLTDGIDGLLVGTFLIAISFFFYFSVYSEINYFIGILFSSLIVFFYFNYPKAKIFMGNVGSLSLGGALVSIAVIMKMEVALFIVGFLYVIEALSVIIQVGYFKISKGKRIFKMAPIHHHFEIVFKSEILTLLVFYTFMTIMVFIAFLIFI